ncbi:hypothetical protein DFA_10608 [Cavenderia fasciculata]|uniref:Transmembrane protein n=1 Tax=Cavenderia fasciculata TaxID=261658 RepID=F4QAP6_CACFS|nr:uncharacterized protein DFA_10608 [Cavenderia fasciculata]EGG15765.1 hypothetical protein DFA_10608 [Cavenderia fasciculata]|eukprot:XP_004354512.1 hypothetical protein DFA_10608 [Cavenderia fasciculata]
MGVQIDEEIYDQQDDQQNKNISQSESSPLIAPPTSASSIPIDVPVNVNSPNVQYVLPARPVPVIKKSNICLMISLIILNLILQNGLGIIIFNYSPIKYLFIAPIVLGVLALLSRSKAIHIASFSLSVILFFASAFWACVLTFIISYYSPLRYSFASSISSIVYLLITSVCMRYHARYIKYLSAQQKNGESTCLFKKSAICSVATNNNNNVRQPTTIAPSINPTFVYKQNGSVVPNNNNNNVFYPQLQPMNSFGGAYPPQQQYFVPFNNPFPQQMQQQQSQQQQQQQQQQYYPIPYYYSIPQQQQQQQPPQQPKQ